jgi:hypothetical protein
MRLLKVTGHDSSRELAAGQLLASARTHKGASQVWFHSGY